MLDNIEKIGNALPHPATIFGALAVLVVIASAIAASFDVDVIHPGRVDVITVSTFEPDPAAEKILSEDVVDEESGRVILPADSELDEESLSLLREQGVERVLVYKIDREDALIRVKNLLSAPEVRWMFENIENNFVHFPPLGLVLVVMIGIGLAEGSGLMNVLIRALVLKAPPKLITMALVFAGVVSHVASEAGYIILIPLGALIFHALGRHPMAGLAAAFAGVSGGFGANFIISSVDPVLAGLTQSAAQFLDPELIVSPAVNYYFMFVSAIMIVLVGTWVTEKIVEPRLGKYSGDEPVVELEKLTAIEKKGLKWAGISVLLTLIAFVVVTVPENGLLRHPGLPMLRSAFFNGMIVAIMLFFFIPGLVYGIVTGATKNDKDAVKQMIASMRTMATYIVLVFFAAQFVYFFRHSELGVVIAINGATFLKTIGLTGIPLMIAFVFVAAFINMFMGSASAKWAIMAPVFVPMFMLLGYHPGLTQMVFRIGDSLTNVVTPMMSYFALIVAFAEKYDEDYGMGTIISTMLPYTIVLGIMWILLLAGWMALGLPMGPDGPLNYLP